MKKQYALLSKHQESTMGNLQNKKSSSTASFWSLVCLFITLLLAFSLVLTPVSQALASEASLDVFDEATIAEETDETSMTEPEVDAAVGPEEEPIAESEEGATAESELEAAAELEVVEEINETNASETEVNALAQVVEIVPANFPDAKFLNYVSTTFDTDADAWLSDTEINNAFTVSVTTEGITDLTGIEYFTEMTRLECSNNGLAHLDLSKNTKLVYLYCGDNSLRQLDLSKNTKLNYLYCSDNILTQLDLSKNTELTHLFCGDNYLTQLDVSKNTKLISLYCEHNSLTQLDLSKNAELASLYCGSNSLTQLDLSKNTKISYLNVRSNKLSTLDTSTLVALETIIFELNNLSVLDFRNNKQLTSAYHAANGETVYISAGMLDYIGCHAIPSHTGNLVIDLEGFYTTQADGSRTVDFNTVLSPVMIAQITEPASSLYDPATQIMTIPADSTTAVIKAKNGNVFTFHLNLGQLGSHTVTYLNEGSVHHQESVLTGNAVSSPAAPTKEGHTFLGWFYDQSGSKAYDFSTLVTSDLTLHAAWRPLAAQTTAQALPRTGDMNLPAMALSGCILVAAGALLAGASRRVAKRKN